MTDEGRGFTVFLSYGFLLAFVIRILFWGWEFMSMTFLFSFIGLQILAALFPRKK